MSLMENCTAEAGIIALIIFSDTNMSLFFLSDSNLFFFHRIELGHCPIHTLDSMRKHSDAIVLTIPLLSAIGLHLLIQY